MSSLGAAGCKWTKEDKYCDQYHYKDEIHQHQCRIYGKLDSNWQDEPFRSKKCEKEFNLEMSKRNLR
jgi:hypothetical protein